MNGVIWENSQVKIVFNGENGCLQSIFNRVTNTEYLCPSDVTRAPFRVFSALKKAFEIFINDKFQLVFDNPENYADTIIEPGRCRFSSVQKDDSLALLYRQQNLVVGLYITEGDSPGITSWCLRITNEGDSIEEVLVSFPFLEGVRLGPNPEKNLATAMDMAGVVVPAWERSGGVLGESNQFSMQWHAIWDPMSHSSLGLIFADPEVRPKRLVLDGDHGSIDLQYFPPVKLAPGEVWDLPTFQLLVCKGDWRPVARAYKKWYIHAYPSVTPPAWFRESDGLVGVHLKKKKEDKTTPSYPGLYEMNNFSELSSFHLRRPVDCSEYAFFCQGSANIFEGDYIPHTDGENIIREDLGGAEGLREAIEEIHRLGFHVTLYVEGYLLHKSSSLAQKGFGEKWSVMHKDGSITGPYTQQGFYHMCPGCKEWQDHLARMVARLLSETGVDGIRLDSLGFYYWPCYNPYHTHESPFGYNDWLKELLSKVRLAAVKVKPDVLLLTEGPADWIGQWFHGALTARCPRELPFMRIAVEPFRPYVYASGALWGALAGFPGGGCDSPDIDHIDWKWLCARYTAHEALVWGEVCDPDPFVDDLEIVTRCFQGDGYWAILAARPASQESIWPRGTSISSKHATYTVKVPNIGENVVELVLCDVEKLSWELLPFEKIGNDIVFTINSNWALVIAREIWGPGLVVFDHLSPVRRGNSIKITTRQLTKTPLKADFSVLAPGLKVRDVKYDVHTHNVVIDVPEDALQGYYKVSLKGKNILGFRRFLTVE